MSKRTRESMIRIRLLSCFLLVSCAVAADGTGDWTLDRLMHELAGVEQRQARFVETRELALLAQALSSRGTLSFQRPDRLVKQFDPPDGQRYEIEANRLLIRNPDGGEEIVRLDNAPQLLAYVAAMQAVLAGDEERLLRYFELRLEGPREAWHLLLIPKAPALVKRLKRVEIDGSRSDISQFRIMEQNGDFVVTRLTQADAE